MTKKEFMDGLGGLGKMDEEQRKFAEWIWEETKDVKPLTKKDLPYVWYCKDGDILHVTLDMEVNDGYYASRSKDGGMLDTWHTFDKRDKLVGFQLWGFSKASPEKIDKAISSMGLKSDTKMSIVRKMAKFR